jgi:acyl-homoserine-lactone acylase
MRGYRSIVAALAVLVVTAPAPARAQSSLERGDAPHGEIIWDKFGIPHIYGDTIEDVLFGYGFAHMENQAETILRKVAIARGRRAEYFGAGDQNANITSDIQIRTYDIPRRSQRWLEEGTEEQRRFLRIFCLGANAYADQHGATIDPSFRQVLPIVPTDILAVSQNTIHFGFMTGDSNVPALAAAWQQGQTLASPAAQSAKSGSNGWALAPHKSATGRTILMGNPHLVWGVSQPLPDSGLLPELDIFQWFEAHLVIGDRDHPRLNASGVAFTGAPFIGIGFSDDIAWTHTDNILKNADLYDIALSGPDEYVFDGETHKLHQRQDQIKVRQPDGSLATIAFTVRSSVQGPIIAERGDGHVLALRVAGLDGTSITSEYWGMMRAHDLGEFNRANETLQMPFFNVIAADRHGEIMYLFGGKQPVRHGGTFADYLGVLNGNTARTLWTETLPWRSLPKTIDPPGGFVQNSNDPPWTSTFPRTLFPAAFPAWISPVEMTLRPQHGATFLLSKPFFTADEVIAGKESTKLLLASRLLPDLMAAARASADPTAQRAASVLAAWDQTADAASKGGPLFERWYELYITDPRTPQSPVFGFGYPAFKTEWSLDNALTTPVGLADPTGAVPALVAAANELQGQFGAIDVDWGTVHRVVLVTHNGPFTQSTPVSNAPQSGAPDIYGPLRVIGSVPQGPARLGFGGDSYVQVIELDPLGPATARAVLTYGNATRPASPHITDQLAIFEAKTLRPVLRQRAEVLANAVTTEKY